MTFPKNNGSLSELQFRVIGLVENNPLVNQGELSKNLGISWGGVTNILKSWLLKGRSKYKFLIKK
jgi:DNA-binding MarR family transcriptional regulator